MAYISISRVKFLVSIQAIVNVKCNSVLDITLRLGSVDVTEHAKRVE